MDLGETVLLAAAFEDGAALLYSGWLVKSVRRYWQKVHSEKPHRSRGYRQIARKESRQVEHHSHFIGECVRREWGRSLSGI